MFTYKDIIKLLKDTDNGVKFLQMRDAEKTNKIKTTVFVPLDSSLASLIKKYNGKLNEKFKTSCVVDDIKYIYASYEHRQRNLEVNYDYMLLYYIIHGGTVVEPAKLKIISGDDIMKIMQLTYGNEPEVES